MSKSFATYGFRGSIVIKINFEKLKRHLAVPLKQN
jgi:hypothetical protein